MQLLKRLQDETARRARQVRTFPLATITAVRQWRRRTLLEEAEAERLDRIRNPSKYLGKS